MEQAGFYTGTYFVLMGHLSPLDGIGPEDLGFGHLQRLLEDGAVTEIIVATNLTMEGEATADYVQQLTTGRDIKVTRLARGVPVGGELEYMDNGTLEQAFVGRRPI